MTPAPAPGFQPPTPEQRECWSLSERRVAFRRRIYPATPIPVPVETDVSIWKQVIGSAPASPRDYILRAIASRTTLSKSDANRLIFGANLNRSEKHRNFLTENGLPFDSFIHDLAVPEFYGSESRHWDGSELMQIEQEWHSELENIISECQSSKHARILLIAAFRAAQKQHIEELPF